MRKHYSFDFESFDRVLRRMEQRLGQTEQHLPVVFADIVKVVSADDDGTLHLHFDDSSLKDSSTNADVTGERAFLVDVSSLNRLRRCLEAQTNVLVEPRQLSRKIKEKKQLALEVLNLDI